MDRETVAIMLVGLMFLLGVAVGVMLANASRSSESVQYRCSEQQLQEAQPQFRLCVLGSKGIDECTAEIKQLYCTQVQEVKGERGQ